MDNNKFLNYKNITIIIIIIILLFIIIIFYYKLIINHNSSITIPDSSITIPDSSTTIPESSITIPESSITIPESSTTIPDSSITIPDSSTTIPDSSPISPIIDSSVFEKNSNIVNNFDELKHACINAKPGDVINLKPNTKYAGNLIIKNIHGTKNNMIYILGDNTSTIEGETNSKSRTIFIENSTYVYIGYKPSLINSNGEGFNCINSQKGVYITNCSNIIIQNLNIYNIGMEGIHLLNETCDCLISNNKIYNTGLFNANYGEAMYCGCAVSNWNSTIRTPALIGFPDKSDNNIFEYNYCYSNTGENIDIKEGTRNGIVRYNYFEGNKLNNDNSADSWIDIKGQNWNIYNNFMIITLTHGIQIHKTNIPEIYTQQYYINNIAYPAINSGCNNTISLNNMNCMKNNKDMCSGYAVDINSATTGNIVCNDNIFSNASSGFCNIKTIDCYK